MNAKAELHKLLMESYDQGVKDTQQSAIAAIEQAYDAGVSDEREAMAKDWEAKHGYDKHGVAAAIRARGNT